MLKTRIIPCLDVADGRVVKGVNFGDELFKRVRPKQREMDDKGNWFFSKADFEEMSKLIYEFYDQCLWLEDELEAMEAEGNSKGKVK